MAFNKTKALEEAAKLVSQRKISQAIKQYLAIAAKDPQDLPLLNTIGDLCVRDGNTAEALRQFRRLADAYTREGFTLKAIAIFKKIAKLDSQSVDPLIHLAELYASQKLTHESEQQYAQALALCERQGLKEQAGQLLAKLVETDPSNAPRRLQLAALCERTGMDQVAPQLLDALGKAWLAAGEWAKAEDIFERLTLRDSSDSEWQSLLRECRERRAAAKTAEHPPGEAPTGQEAEPLSGELGAKREKPSVEVDFDREWETFASAPPDTGQKTDGAPDAVPDSATSDRPQPPSAPPVAAETGVARSAHSGDDEFAELAFYLDYGLIAEGDECFSRLAATYPGDARLVALKERLQSLVEAEARADASSAPAEPPLIDQRQGAVGGNTFGVPPAVPGEASGDGGALAAGAGTPDLRADQPSGWAPATSLIDKLTQELESAMADEPRSPGAGAGPEPPTIDPAELLAEDGDDLPLEDAPRTHFDLGVAFREIGLLDDAIAEFQKSSKGPVTAEEPWKFEALLLLGVCFMEKGMPSLAAPWLARALESPGLDEDTSMALTYDLATAYERSGNRDGALEKFVQVYGVNAGYRDVAEKIRALQSKQA